jgi:Mg-chelatase subunit ChlD
MDDDLRVPGAVPTSAVTFLETEHGRLRRKQRGIDKKDLQSARKHGARVKGYPRPQNGDPTGKYTYKGISYIVNERTGEEVTSYTVPLKLECIPITEKMQNEYDDAVVKIKLDKGAWLSNTVIVIDTSGSMSEGDIWGARTRLDAAWIAVALDFLAHRLETGAASHMCVISIVTLGREANVVVREQPSSWILYNWLIRTYRKKRIPPYGHGPYFPSLEVAEELLTQNSNASCALMLAFLSDGKPSDSSLGRKRTTEQWNEILVDRVGQLAKNFGRRLNFEAIGIGSLDDFKTLQGMVDAAADYGAIAHFRLPSMSSSGIGDAFTSVAASLTTTQTEMTDVNTLKQRKVRNVLRESKKKAAMPIEVVSSKDFFIYPLSRIKRSVYKEWYMGRKRMTMYEYVSLQHPDAEYVAIHREAFGEGAERLAFRFYEVGADGRTIVGRHMVAKESRLLLEEQESRLVLEEHANERSRKKFVRTFCETQQVARRLAEQFNEKLSKMPRVDQATPKVTFLDCSIYQLDDKILGKQSVLVEERLDESKWHKWNANNGYVEGKKTITFTEEIMRSALTSLDKIDLNIIEEGSDDEEEEESDEDERHIVPILYTPSQVAQAFSHFSYCESHRKRLVCDLQGVYDEKNNVLRFSDPAIHYYDHRREDRRMVHGRTDRGRKGIGMFFETHKDNCSLLCKLSTGGFRRGHRGSLRNKNARQGHRQVQQQTK